LTKFIQIGRYLTEKLCSPWLDSRFKNHWLGMHRFKNHWLGMQRYCIVKTWTKQY